MMLNDQVITLKNDYLKIIVSTLGGTLMDFQVKNLKGVYESIVLGYENLEDYNHNLKNLGANIAPFAGRLYPTKIELNDKEYFLEANFKNKVCLHSASDNTSKMPFSIQKQTDTYLLLNFTDQLTFFPNLNFSISYTLDKNNLVITYTGSSKTYAIFNPTNHSYFNLSGIKQDTIENHSLKMKADYFYELDENFLPLQLISVDNTDFDFKKSRKLGPSLKNLSHTAQKGIDHPFKLNNYPIQLLDEISRRELLIESDYPYVVIYTNNYPTHQNLRFNQTDRSYLGICFECQYVPNNLFLKGEDSSIIPPNKEVSHYIKYTINKT